MKQSGTSGNSFSPLSAVIAVIAISLSLNILQPLLESVFSVNNMQMPLLFLGSIVVTLWMYNSRYVSFSREQVLYSALFVIPAMYLLLRFSTVGEPLSLSWFRFAFYGVMYFVLIARIDQKAFKYFQGIFSVATVLSLTSHFFTFLHVIPAYKVQSVSRVGYMYGFTFSDFQRSDFSNINAWRFYGLANEPGAFGVICFLMFLANGADLKRRINWLYLIAGLCTFSTLFFLLLGTFLVVKNRKVLIVAVLTYGAFIFIPTGSGYVWWLQYKLLPRPHDLWTELLTRWDSSLVSIFDQGPIGIFFGDGSLSYLMGPPAVMVLSGIIGCICYACICVMQPKVLYLPLAIIFLSRTQFPFMFMLMIPLIVQGLQTEHDLPEKKESRSPKVDSVGALHAL